MTPPHPIDNSIAIAIAASYRTYRSHRIARSSIHCNLDNLPPILSQSIFTFFPSLEFHIASSLNSSPPKMANFLASIFGTELDKVNCSFYFVSSSHAKQKTADIQKRNDKEQNKIKRS